MVASELRITAPVLKVLGALMAATDQISGAEIARSTELASGTLYPILIRLEHARWIESRWEVGDPHTLGRPRRRLYRVTAMGARRVRETVKEIKTAIGRPLWGTS